MTWHVITGGREINITREDIEAAFGLAAADEQEYDRGGKTKTPMGQLATFIADGIITMLRDKNPSCDLLFDIQRGQEKHFQEESMSRQQLLR